MGSFRPTTGTRHLHRDYSFTGSLVETAPKSLRLSCRSELRVHPPFPGAQTIPSPCDQLGENCVRVVPSTTARVHSPSDLNDLHQAFAAPMAAVCDEPADECEPFEVTLLTGQ